MSFTSDSRSLVTIDEEKRQSEYRLLHHKERMRKQEAI